MTATYTPPTRPVAEVLAEARVPGRHVFAAPYGVPATDCPGCGERMEAGRTVEYQPPEYPGGSQAEVARFVLWHTQCVVVGSREAGACSACGERHLVDGACLL